MVSRRHNDGAEGEGVMTIENGRIQSLKAEHAKLDERIIALEKRPASDQLEIRKLKRQKLRIKEELKQLQQHTQSAVQAT